MIFQNTTIFLSMLLVGVLSHDPSSPQQRSDAHGHCKIFRAKTEVNVGIGTAKSSVSTGNTKTDSTTVYAKPTTGTSTKVRISTTYFTTITEYTTVYSTPWKSTTRIPQSAVPAVAAQNPPLDTGLTTKAVLSALLPPFILPTSTLRTERISQQSATVKTSSAGVSAAISEPKTDNTPSSTNKPPPNLLSKAQGMASQFIWPTRSTSPSPSEPTSTIPLTSSPSPTPTSSPLFPNNTIAEAEDPAWKSRLKKPNYHDLTVNGGMWADEAVTGGRRVAQGNEGTDSLVRRYGRTVAKHLSTFSTAVGGLGVGNATGV